LQAKKKKENTEKTLDILMWAGTSFPPSIEEGKVEKWGDQRKEKITKMKKKPGNLGKKHPSMKQNNTKTPSKKDLKPGPPRPFARPK